MNRKIAALLAAAALTISLGACTVQVGDPEEQNTPAPVQSEDPDQFMLDVLQQTWDETSYSDQQDLCTFFNMAPDAAYDAFNGGFASDMGTDFPRPLFDEFFSGVC